MSSARSDCGCCKGLALQTPVTINNRPGLKALAYRAGTYPQFRQSMLAKISAMPALEQLSTRDTDDFSIALLDAWAVTLDILTFYQERIANESYLRTATEHLSIQELSRLIGYELRPGVAASTYLAFTLEDARGAPSQAIIDKGTRTQTTPGQGEQAQSFETVETIEARPEWNAIKPRMTQPQNFDAEIESIAVDGIANNLRQGDRLLIVDGKNNPVLLYVNGIDIDFDAKKTRIFIEGRMRSVQTWQPEYEKVQLNDPTELNFDNDLVEKYILEKTWDQRDLIALAKTKGWSLDALKSIIARLISLRKTRPLIVNGEAPDVGVYVMRQSAAIFGHNAPLYESLPASLTIVSDAPYDVPWDDWNLLYYSISKNPPVGALMDDFSDISQDIDFWLLSVPSPNGLPLTDFIDISDLVPVVKVYIYLDRTYAGIIPGSWIILSSSSQESQLSPIFLKIENIDEISSTDFALNMKVSRLTIGVSKRDVSALQKFKIRETSVLIQSERLVLTDVPIEEPVNGNQVMLDRFYPGLKPGQKIIITGEIADSGGFKASEITSLESVNLEDGFTTLTFANMGSLKSTFVRKTVSINANVAQATHGESVQEVLGSGDTSLSFQSFVLHQSPLTYIQSSESESGAKSTLEVRVNDLLWREVPSLYGHGPREHIYTTRRDNDGRTIITFGDGRTGARLPNGKNNVRAYYRKGIGLDGLVEAGKINLLMSRPLGVRDVLNPLPAKGGEDGESLEHARLDAPLEILTLGRIVSIKDYEDFARAYAGIAKAMATWVWSGKRREVVVTAAGPKGEPISMDTAKSLFKAMKRFGDPNVSISIHPESYSRVFFGIQATINIDLDYPLEDTIKEAEARLKNHFSFEARSFGQAVTVGEIMGVIHSVPGIKAVNVTALYRLPLPGDGKKPLDGYLDAAMPGSWPAQAGVAELLLLDHEHISLEAMR